MRLPDLSVFFLHQNLKRSGHAVSYDQFSGASLKTQGLNRIPRVTGRSRKFVQQSFIQQKLIKTL